MRPQAPESASEPKTSDGKLEAIADTALARWDSVPKHVQQMEHIFEQNEDCTAEEGFLMAQYFAHAQCHHRTLAQGVKEQVKEIQDLRAKLADLQSRNQILKEGADKMMDHNEKLETKLAVAREAFNYILMDIKFDGREDPVTNKCREALAKLQDKPRL